MVLDDPRADHEPDNLRAGLRELRSVVDRMSAVLDRMEEQERQQRGTGDA